MNDLMPRNMIFGALGYPKTGHFSRGFRPWKLPPNPLEFLTIQKFQVKMIVLNYFEQYHIKILHSWKLDRWGYVPAKFQANWSRNNFDRPPCVWKSHKIAFCYHVLGYYYAIGFDFFSTLSNMRGFLLDQSVWNFAPTYPQLSTFRECKTFLCDVVLRFLARSLCFCNDVVFWG